MVLVEQVRNCLIFFIVYRMEFDKTGGPAHGIVIKTVHKTLPGVVGVQGVFG